MKMDSLAHNEYFNALGEYCSQFMYIKLHDVNHSTLFHEYIHHIQNVTTYYSINTFLCLKMLFFDRIIDIRGWDSSCKLSGLYARNIFLLSKTIGDRADIPFNKVEITNKYFITVDNRITAVGLHLLIDKTPKEYVFGTIAIKECMANIIEQQYYPNKKMNNVLTYHICEILICDLCPSIKGNAAAILAIMELSLMSVSPVEALIHILVKLKDEKYGNVSPSTILSIVSSFSTYSMNQNGVVKKTMLDEMHDDLLEKIDSTLDLFYHLFSQSELIIPFKDWQKETLKSSFLIRKEHPLLLTSMLNENVYSVKNDDNPISSYHIKFPIIIDRDYKNIHFNNDNIRGKLLMFLAEEEAFQQLTNLQTGKKTGCRLKEYCKKYVKYGGRTKTATLNFRWTTADKLDKLLSIYNEELCSNPTKREKNNFGCIFSKMWGDIIDNGD